MRNSFAVLWIRRACHRTLSIGTGVGGGVSGFLPVVAHFVPSWSQAVNELFWEIPIFALAGAAGFRLLAAPYELWKEQKARADQLEAKLAESRLAPTVAMTDADRKMALLDKLRDLTHLFCVSDPDEDFYSFIRRDRSYLDIQPHFCSEYRAQIMERAGSRIAIATRDDTDYDATLFLAELVRIQKEWNL